MNVMTRREALKAAVGAGALATTCGVPALAANGGKGFSEPGRVLPLAEDADLMLVASTTEGNASLTLEGGSAVTAKTIR